MSYKSSLQQPTKQNPRRGINKSAKQTNVKLAAGTTKKWEEPIEPATTPEKKCPPKRDHRAYRATKRSNVTEERAVASQRNAAAPQIRAAACRPELRLLRRQRRQLPSPTTAAVWDYVLQCESDCCGRCSSSKLLSAVKTIFLRSVRACVRSCFVFAEIEQHQQSARKKIETSSVTFALVIAR